MATSANKKTPTRTREKRGKDRTKAKPRGYVPGIRKPEEFRQYALFLALPTEDRKTIFGFTTDKQFGDKFDIHPGTLSEWKWNEDLWEIRDQHLIIFKKHTADIINALAKRAKRTGEAFHSLSFLKVVEGFTEKQGLDITSKGRKVSGFEVVVRHAAHSPTTSRNPKPEGKQ